MFGILDYLKMGAGVAVGILVTSLYWTGIPILNDYPILKNIPLLGDLAVGHIETVKQEARSGYVLESEKLAAEALAKKYLGDLILAQQIREQADKAAEQLEIKAQENRDADEKAIADDKAKGPTVTRDDLDWLGRVRNGR
jgi:hypothetical protein